MKPLLFHQPVRVRKVLLYHLYIIMATLSPMVISMLAGFVGYCMGCQINEAGADNCIRAGISFGSVLNPLGTLFWLSIITVPLGVIATIALIIAAIHDTIYHNGE